jgi:hypothetical protein
MNIMQTNNHQTVDYGAVLDAKFGAVGTESRKAAEEKAMAFYTYLSLKYYHSWFVDV